MKAAVLYGKEDVRVEEVPMPPLRPGELRVRIEVALTCGTDLKVFKRGYHAKMIVPPAVFGHEFAGVVCEVHPHTRDWQVGERVVAANSAPCVECLACEQGQENLCDDLLFLNGAYAESIVVPARLVKHNLHRLQPDTKFRDAALVEPLACVVQGLHDCAPRRSQRLLVIGAGPIGLMFVALAKHLRCNVAVAGRGGHRLEMSRRLGATHIVDMAGRDDVAAAVKDSGADAFDIVIEAVGKPETWQAALLLVRKGGKVNFFGGCPAGTSVSLDTGLIHYSNLTLLASFHHTPRTVRKALEYLETGVVSAMDFVDGECALDELPRLFGEMARGNHAVKTLIRVQDAVTPDATFA
jgi:L-iditol 2-dehydrogenase